MWSDQAISLYDRLIVRFGTDGRLSGIHQAELEAIRIEGDIDKNDTFWLWFLPIYLTQARLDFLGESYLANGSGKLQGTDLNKLAEGIAARIEPDQIRNEIDTAVIARAVAKSAAPDIQAVIEEAVANIQKQTYVAIDPATIRSIVLEASRDSLINRNLMIAALAGFLMAMLAGWYSGWSSDRQWQQIVNSQRVQIQELQK